MDATDLRIVRAMGLRPFEWSPRDPERFRPATLGALVGLSPEAVTARIQRMRKQGILLGFEAYPNVRHFGLGQTTFHLQVTDDVKDHAVDDLTAVDGLVEVYDFLGQDLCVDFVYRDAADLSRKLRLVKRLMGQDEVVPFYEWGFPQPKRALTPLDWRIIQALRGDARRSPEEVAADVGVSGRTVRRRVAAMEAGGDIDIVAVLDVGRIPDLSVFNLVFFVGDPAPGMIQRIRSEFEASFLYAWQPPSDRFGSYHAAVFAANNHEMEQLRRRASAMDGVSRCEVMFPARRYLGQPWLDAAIAERAVSKDGVVAPVA